jgi:hypothetical protein
MATRVRRCPSYSAPIALGNAVRGVMWRDALWWCRVVCVVVCGGGRGAGLCKHQIHLPALKKGPQGQPLHRTPPQSPPGVTCQRGRDTPMASMDELSCKRTDGSRAMTERPCCARRRKRANQLVVPSFRSCMPWAKANSHKADATFV